MENSTTPLFHNKQQARALGLKLVLICGLAMLMWVPSFAVWLLSAERASRADDVVQEIISASGGPQTIVGPYILLPIDIVTTRQVRDEEREYTKRSVMYYFPTELMVTSDLKTQTKERSIYKAVIYEGDIKLEGKFSSPDLSRLEGQVIPRWDLAQLGLQLGHGNMRGLKGSPFVVIDGKTVNGKFSRGYEIGVNEFAAGPVSNLSVTGLYLPLAPQNENGFRFEIGLQLSGGESFNIAPIAEDTKLSVVSNWPHPSFNNILPDTHDIKDSGFEAQWQVPFLARNYPDRVVFDIGDGVINVDQVMQIKFAQPGSPWQKVDRLLKYALMFVGLIFLCVFLMEVLFKSRAHPIQYAFIGAAQIVFYLMVLAFSEHFGFDQSFIGTAAATVLLTGLYAGSVMRRVSAGIMALIVFAAVYGIIWLLMRSEDHGLIIGSITAFGALSITMFTTRNIDWYGEIGHKPQQV